jgi:exodeoxyribonuclease V gamma subunit
MLHLHRAERSDTLADALAAVLAQPPSNPFAVDVVSVPTKGVERWLAQRLAGTLGSSGSGDGVCANVVFPQPLKLIAEALAAASDQPPDEAWSAGHLAWTVLDAVSDGAAETWAAPLARYAKVTDETPPGARLIVAQKIARLFTSYADNRPQMLRDWADGKDTDGAGGTVSPDLAWQPTLWRKVRERIANPSPAERLPAACQQLRREPARIDLPERISLFGPTRLTTTALEVLAALAQHRAVHLWLPHPSDEMWQRVKGYAVDARPHRRSDPSTAAARTPLLASLSSDVRELQQHIAAGLPDHIDEHCGGRRWPETLLGHLQRSIAEDQEPTAPIRLDEADRSVQVHACHGPARQVEVLREVLVGLLADDDTLEPRDVIVMCPDIEDYAALVSGAFGLADDTGDAHPGHRLRVRLADRSLRQTNPLLGLLAALLDLAQARVTASELLDLAARTPVRRRFNFSDDDLEVLADWVAKSGVRWGLDAAHRHAYQLGGVAQNTWRAGLDRILLGAAMADEEHRWIATALPYDDVDSNDIDLAGRLAELVDRVASVIDGLSGIQPLSGWVAALTEALDLLAAAPDGDAWQTGQVRRVLADLLDGADVNADTVDLSLGDMNALLGDRLEGRPTRANFRTGHLTMCSMQPMRSVPHRVVCLLGLDDGRFPRRATPDGDDILARDPLVGERHPRTEDRQILLDAVMAAGDHLVLVYTGADPRTNVTLPPAVPVGEVLDALDTLATTADGRHARQQVLIRHPLQPFDPRNFQAGELGPTRPFSFDHVALRGARRASQPRMDPPPFLADRLPEPEGDADDVTLDELVWFVENPARGFLRQRLGLTLLGDEEEPSDALSIELTRLPKWNVGERLLQARLRGADAAVAVDAEWRRGTVPPRDLGKHALGEIMAEVEPLVTAAARYAGVPARTVDLVADLHETRLTGTVVGVRDSAVLRVTFSNLAAKHRLRAWLQLLALTAAFPGTQWTAVTIGKGGRRGSQSTLGPMDPVDARRVLDDLLALRAEGLCRVLPMATKTSARYAAGRGSGEDNALRAAETEWAGGDFPERADAAYALVWGDEANFSRLSAEPAEHHRREQTLFGELALRVWQPLLDAEERARL